MKTAPFDKFRVRSLLWWMPLSALFLLLVSFIPGFETDSSLVFRTWFLLSVAGWVLWKAWRCDLNFKQLIGPVSPSRERWALTGMGLPNFLFSVGALWLVYYPLSFAAPSYVEDFLNDILFQLHDHSFLYNTGSFILIVIAAPVIEEVVFRGILLNRWASKWDVVPAAFASSLAFGLLHPNRFSAFVIGLVLAVLYLKTCSLLIPIAAHAVTNAIAFGFAVYEAALAGAPLIVTIEVLRSNYWIGIVCLGLSVPVLAYFFYKNRPATGWHAPYERNANPAGGTPPPASGGHDALGTQTTNTWSGR